MAEDAIASVETKLGALIESLSPDELEVFGAVLSDWREFEDADDVEGFGAHHESNRSREQIFGLLDAVSTKRTPVRSASPSDLG